MVTDSFSTNNYCAYNYCRSCSAVGLDLDFAAIEIETEKCGDIWPFGNLMDLAWVELARPNNCWCNEDLEHNGVAGPSSNSTYF